MYLEKLAIDNRDPIKSSAVVIKSIYNNKAVVHIFIENKDKYTAKTICS